MLSQPAYDSWNIQWLPERDLIRKGRDLEKVVLARAVDLHLRNRVLVYANKTVVFD